MPKFSDAGEQRDYGAPIPDGTYVKLIGHLNRGGHTIDGEHPDDAGLFKKSKSSDAVGLDWDFIVDGGEYATRHIFQFMTVDGGARDEKGASKAGTISKRALRAMIDSWFNLNPKDESPEATARRDPPSYSVLDQVVFAARLGIEPGAENDRGGYFPDKSKIDHIVVPGEPEYAAVMAGQPVAPKPSGTSAPRASGGTAKHEAAKPAWQREAAPAQASPGASSVWAGGSAGQGQTAAQPAGGQAATGTPATAQPGEALPAWARQ